MTDSKLRALAIMRVLAFLPSPIGESLISDPGFRTDFHIHGDAILTFGSPPVSFRRSKLYRAARLAARKTTAAVTDEQGRKWTLTSFKRRSSASVRLTHKRSVLHMDHLLFIAGDRVTRVRILDAECQRLNITGTQAATWRSLLHSRVLTDDELDRFIGEIAETPVSVHTLVQQKIREGNIGLDVLVPRSATYYERLVGRYSDQSNISDYLAEVLGAHIGSLVKWNRIQGLTDSLALDVHPVVGEYLNTLSISAADLGLVAQRTLGADAISICSCVTLALRARRVAAWKIHVLPLTERLLAKEGSSRFSLLAAMFSMVYGELSKTRVLQGRPPFWRRLAALAHASHLCRDLMSVPGNHSQFIEWVASIRVREHVAQTYADMRVEPRWIAELATARQLRHEFAGRTLSVAISTGASMVEALGLKELLVGESEASLLKQLTPSLITLPGPMEGNINPSLQLDDGYVARLREELSADLPPLSAYVQIANAVLYARLPEDFPHLVAAGIRRAQFRLGFTNNDYLQSALVGFSMLAAMTRCTELADAVFILMRVGRHTYGETFDAESMLRIGMIASASRERLDEWCECVGRLTLELGVASLSREESTGLHLQVSDLCHAVPELWATCSKGIAALEAAATLRA